MSGTITWSVNADFKRMVDLAITLGKQLAFVKDQGVYLMAGSYPNNLVCYAKGFDPKKDDFDDWYDTARAICGGDDFVEYIDPAFIKRGIDNKKRVFKIHLTETQIKLEI